MVGWLVGPASRAGLAGREAGSLPVGPVGWLARRSVHLAGWLAPVWRVVGWVWLAPGWPTPMWPAGRGRRPTRGLGFADWRGWLILCPVSPGGVGGRFAAQLRRLLWAAGSRARFRRLAWMSGSLPPASGRLSWLAAGWLASGIRNGWAWWAPAWSGPAWLGAGMGSGAGWLGAGTVRVLAWLGVAISRLGWAGLRLTGQSSGLVGYLAGVSVGAGLFGGLGRAVTRVWLAVVAGREDGHRGWGCSEATGR